MKSPHRPVAKMELLIRKPVADVFEAFVNPDAITKFWFNRSSGRIETGATVTWYWDLYNASSVVKVLEVEKEHRFCIEWDADSDNPSNVEWKFEDRAERGTYVSVVHSGFDKEAEDFIEQIVDSTGGFPLVLAAAKVYLEHGIELNIVADRF